MRAILMTVTLTGMLFGSAVCAADGDLAQTEREYRTAMREGARFAREGQNARALARFKRAVQLKPRSPQAHFRVALTYLDRGLYMAAEENARKATYLDSGFAPAWLVLGSALFHQDREQEAVSPLQRAFRLDNTSAHAAYMLGRAYYFLPAKDRDKREDYRRALEYFQQALRLKSSYTEARFMEGCCFLELDLPEPARQSFIATLRDDPDNPEVYFRLALCELRTQRYLDAESYLRAALQKAPQHPEAHLFLADLLWDHLGDREQAALHYRRYLGAAPDDHAARGRVERRLEDAGIAPDAGTRF